MTEQEWLEEGQSTDRMYNLACVRGLPERKARLVVCAYCRIFWGQFPTECRNAVEMGERYADGLVKQGRASEANSALFKRLPDLEPTGRSAWLTLVPSAWSALASLGSGGNRNKANGILPSLYRHIFGNPFRPYPPTKNWPTTVVQLADALYNGQDCGFALHDALLEAGHPELADHFRQEQNHPKGCWVLDLILGKE